MFQAAGDRVRAIVPEALDVVEARIAAGDARAAMAFLKWAGGSCVDVAPPGPDTLEGALDDLGQQTEGDIVARLSRSSDFARNQLLKSLSRYLEPPGQLPT